MDASTLHQYRFVQLFLGAGLVAGMLAVALLRIAGTGTGGPAEAARDATRVSPWRDVLGLLVAVATSVTLLYLLPIGLVFRFFQTWQSVALLVAFVIVAAAPGVYAVRTRTL